MGDKTAANSSVSWTFHEDGKPPVIMHEHSMPIFSRIKSEKKTGILVLTMQGGKAITPGQEQYVFTKGRLHSVTRAGHEELIGEQEKNKGF